MFHTTIAVTVLAFAIVTQSFGGVAPVVLDNPSITHQTPESRGDEYFLESIEGVHLIVPRQLVVLMRLSGAGEQPQYEENLLYDTDPAECTDKSPTDSLSPGRKEQLAVFGDTPAPFRPAPISPIWQYEDILGAETDVSDFNPSRWFRAPIDPTWSYENDPAFEGDETQFNPARWFRSSIERWWCPTDGWRRSPGRFAR